MASKTLVKDGPRTVEVDGISVEVAVDPADDYELAECSTVIYDPASTPAERSRAIVRQNRLVLGDAHDRVMAELRERNGGRLPISAVTAFVNSVIEAVEELKN